MRRVANHAEVSYEESVDFGRATFPVPLPVCISRGIHVKTNAFFVCTFSAHLIKKVYACVAVLRYVPCVGGGDFILWLVGWSPSRRRLNSAAKMQNHSFDKVTILSPRENTSLLVGKPLSFVGAFFFSQKQPSLQSNTVQLYKGKKHFFLLCRKEKWETWEGEAGFLVLVPKWCLRFEFPPIALH